MAEEKHRSRFQQVIEAVEELPPDDQWLLIEIVRQRLIQHRREQLAADIAEAQADYREGRVRRGPLTELTKELKG